MKQPEIKIPNFVEVASVAQTEIENTEQSVTLVEEMKVENDEGLEMAARWIAAVKTSKKEIDNKRKSIVKPLNDVVKDLNAMFKPAIDALAGMEKALKGKVVEHIERSLERRDALLGSVKEQKAPEDKSTLIQQASALVPKTVPGVSFREVWTGQIEDPGKIVAWAIENNRQELLLPNEMILDMLTKSKRKDPEIPGWRAFLKRTVAITAAKIK